jgi:shikimate kinase
MRIFITGVGCIGKTTIGKKVASIMNCYFFDLDQEIENYFNVSIEKLQNRFLTIHSFRDEASKALVHILNQPESENCIIALPPSGLMSGYWRVVKKTVGIKIALIDRPENILERIIFLDIDSKPIKKILSDKEKKLYLKEIKKDITYFGKSYERADFQVNISGLNSSKSAKKTIEALRDYTKTN